MTADKVREVIAVYRRRFEELGVRKKKAPPDAFPVTNEEFLAHCHAMLDEMEAFLDQGRIEKVFRWLGFNQGCLWRCGIYTIEEMRAHNRSQ